MPLCSQVQEHLSCQLKALYFSFVALSTRNYSQDCAVNIWLFSESYKLPEGSTSDFPSPSLEPSYAKSSANEWNQLPDQWFSVGGSVGSCPGYSLGSAGAEDLVVSKAMMLPNIPQGTGQPPQQRITQPQMSLVLRLRNLCWITPFMCDYAWAGQALADLHTHVLSLFLSFK